METIQIDVRTWNAIRVLSTEMELSVPEVVAAAVDLLAEEQVRVELARGEHPRSSGKVGKSAGAYTQGSGR